MDNSVVLLKAAEASITTCTVTIKAIKINNRQMTHSVFRQLPTEPLFDETTLEIADNVNIWGWVNYKPSGEEESGTQFVVQKGERLVRCPSWVRHLGKQHSAWPHLLKASATDATRDAALYLLTTALEGTLVYNEEKETTWPHEVHQNYWVDMRSPFGHQCFVPGKGNTLTHAHGVAIKNAIKPTSTVGWNDTDRVQRVLVSEGKVRESGQESLRTAIKELITKSAERSPEIFTSAFWRDRLDKRASAATDYVKCWNDLMVKLKAVEQLYIAT